MSAWKAASGPDGARFSGSQSPQRDNSPGALLGWLLLFPLRSVFPAMVLSLGAHASERSCISRCSAGKVPCKVGLVAGLSARSQPPFLLCTSPASRD
eukprot:12895661-Heterocapsa_arctica.AAC.1